MTKKKLTFSNRIAFRLRVFFSKYYNRKFRAGKLKMLFVFGHMRSGSSLLLHVLNSNKDIVGYGETHNRYRSKADFGKTAFDVLMAYKRLRASKYILDKPLHDHLIVDPQLLNDSKTIFMLRDPESSLQSILKIKVPFIQTIERATNYYVDRLLEIERFAKELPKEAWTFTEYQNLVKDPGPVLLHLQTFLELDEPLTSTYKTMFATGKEFVGDTSNLINSGKIEMKPRPTVKAEHAPFVKKARVEYEHCLKVLHELKS